MAIKVVVNYPETKEGMEELKRRHAEAMLICLRKKLGEEQLDKLMKGLIEEYENK